MRTKTQPTISVIGAGRMGTALALAAMRSGYTIEALVVRRPARRAPLALRAAYDLLHCPIIAADDLARLPESDIFFLTTPDDSLLKTAENLFAVFRERPPKQRIALHASGALASEEIAVLRGAKFAVASLHPLVSISAPLTGADSLRTANFCLEGDARAVRVARAIVGALGGQSFSIKTEDKPLYHAAAVLSSGHVIALLDVALELLRRCGLSDALSRRLIVPLVQTTIDNFAGQGAVGALTGPFARFDARVIRKHLDALSSLSDALPLDVYRTLGQRASALASQKNRSRSGLAELQNLLGADTKQRKS